MIDTLNKHPPNICARVILLNMFKDKLVNFKLSIKWSIFGGCNVVASYW